MNNNVNASSGSNKCSITSLQCEEQGGFMLKINKTSKKKSEISSGSLSIKNLKEDFDVEYKFEKENSARE